VLDRPLCFVTLSVIVSKFCCGMATAYGYVSTDYIKAISFGPSRANAAFRLRKRSGNGRLPVWIGNAYRRGQGKHHMVIRHRQQIGLPGFEPALGCTGLTLRAMPVAARVVGDVLMIASGAAQDMSKGMG
jgi:hypothetical protein